jgi:hypothetical protein
VTDWLTTLADQLADKLADLLITLNAIGIYQPLEDYPNTAPLAQITSMTESLSQKLELINAYCTKMISYQGIAQIAVDLHVALLRFCCAVVEGFTGTFYGL